MGALAFPTTIETSIADRELLVQLFNAQDHRVHIYSLHEKFHLSPAQVSRSIGKFEPQGILSLNGTWIEITELGIRWLLANRLRLLGELPSYEWKTIPNNMRTEQREPDAYYAPRKKHMGKHFFEDMKQIGQMSEHD